MLQFLECSARSIASPWAKVNPYSGVPLSCRSRPTLAPPCAQSWLRAAQGKRGLGANVLVDPGGSF